MVKVTERRVPQLIPVRGSQPACNVSHKPGSRLPLCPLIYMRQAIGRGHSRAMLRSEPTTRYRRRQRPTGQPFGCYRHSKHIGSQVTGSDVLIFIQAPTHRCNVVKSWHKGTQVVTWCFIRPMCYTPLSFVSLPFPFFRFLPFSSIFFPLHPVSTFVFSSFLLLLSFCIFSFSPVLIPSVSSHFDGKSE